MTPEIHRVAVRLRWHARKAGGIFVGIRLSFPVSILYDNDEVRPTWQVNVGLLVATVDITFRGRATHTHTHNVSVSISEKGAR